MIWKLFGPSGKALHIFFSSAIKKIALYGSSRNVIIKKKITKMQNIMVDCYNSLLELFRLVSHSCDRWDTDVELNVFSWSIEKWSWLQWTLHLTSLHHTRLDSQTECYENPVMLLCFTASNKCFCTSLIFSGFSCLIEVPHLIAYLIWPPGWQ